MVKNISRVKQFTDGQSLVYGAARWITATLGNLVESSWTTALIKCFEHMHDESIAVLRYRPTSTHSGANRQPQDVMPRRINARLLQNPVYGQLDSCSDVRGGWMHERRNSTSITPLLDGSSLSVISTITSSVLVSKEINQSTSKVLQY